MLLCLHELFPAAPIYTLFYKKEPPDGKRTKIDETIESLNGKNGQEVFFNTYKELLKNISIYHVNVKRKDFDSGKLKGIVEIKGISAVSIFSLIYKIFFNLNYSLVFKLV